MSEEQKTEKKASRLRQSTVEREPLRSTIKARPMMAYPEDEDDDRLKIPTEIMDEFHAENIDLQWITTEVFGQPNQQRRAQFQRKGWEPVMADDFGGRLGERFMPKGYQGEVNVEGLVLMQRPLEFTLIARKRERDKATGQVKAKEDQMRGGDIPGVSFDSRHPSALRSNVLNKGFERMTIPSDDS